MSDPEGKWLINENGGNLITVTTNAKKNVEFYIKNGFSLVKEETLECNGKSVGNWTFRMDLLRLIWR